MDIETLKELLINETSLFTSVKPEIVEIGDGNINRVFRATSSSGQTYVIKYASSQANISNSIRLNKERGRIESAYLKEIGRYLPMYVPAVLSYSEKNHYIIMQDLSLWYNVLQQELAVGKQFDFLAHQLAEYVAVAGYSFSDFSLPVEKKAALQKQFSNPELCELTEQLVFTEPFFDCPNNSFSEKNRTFVNREIYRNMDIANAAKQLKDIFMHDSQSLIHGDLHFGSIFVSETDIKVFDPEFCFFGPIGYDLGNLLAHFLLQFAYHAAIKKNGNLPFCAWLRTQALCLLEAFEKRFLELVSGSIEPGEKKQATHDVLRKVLCHTAGYAGTECIRRIIGLAKVNAFVFNSEAEKAQYEICALSIGKHLLEKYKTFTTVHAFEESFNSLLR